MVQLARELKLEAKWGKALRSLDLYYLSSRYPDALPDHEVPTESFDEDQATEALEVARQVVEFVRGQFP